MSQALVDKLLKETLKVANDAFGRKGVDRAMQEVTVSRANLKNGFKEAFSKEHSKEFKGHSSPFTKDDPVFNDAAAAAFTALETHLNRSNTKSSLIRKTSQSIVFSQPRYLRAPFTRMKRAGVKEINKRLKELNRAPLSKGQERSIEKGLERLHVETTAGMARLAYVLNRFEQNEITQKFFSSKQYSKLSQKYGDVRAQYEVKQGAKGPEIKYKQTVSLHVAPKSKNYAGSESKDWKKVKPKLEKEIADWIKTMRPEEQEASQSPIDNLRDHAIDRISQKFSRVATVTTKKKRKTKKLNRKPSPVVEKAKPVNTRTRTIQADWIIGTRAVQSAASAPLALIAEFNRRLPQALARNMQSPALNYRTGRFANSVEVLDVNTTAQGFLSFGYTYQKYPYQTFEPGYAMGDPDRDPRKLIDRTMREIAVEFAMGRFYTRRL